jgi:ATP-dependent Clp protease ATP-binding subunit ClpA
MAGPLDTAEYIASTDVEHLALAIIGVECVANRILSSLGVEVVELQSELERLVPKNESSDKFAWPLSSQTADALEIAAAMAAQSENAYINTGYMLLGLARTKCTVSDLLTIQHVTPVQIEAELVKLTEAAEGPVEELPPSELPFFQDMYRELRENPRNFFGGTCIVGTLLSLILGVIGLLVYGVYQLVIWLVA